jgi:TRAP-type uncharacterized transport system fused permease subunit
MEEKMESSLQQHNEHKKKQDSRPIVKALLIGWSVFYLLYTLLGVWLGTGEDALAGPRTSLADYIFSTVWLSLGVLQLVVTIMLKKYSKRWLWWVAIAFAVLSLGTVIGPPLLAPLFSM